MHLHACSEQKSIVSECQTTCTISKLDNITPGWGINKRKQVRIQSDITTTTVHVARNNVVLFIQNPLILSMKIGVKKRKSFIIFMNPIATGT